MAFLCRDLSQSQFSALSMHVVSNKTMTMHHDKRVRIIARQISLLS